MLECWLFKKAYHGQIFLQEMLAKTVYPLTERAHLLTTHC